MKALKEYLASSPRGTATRLAEHLGVSVVVVSQWIADDKPKAVPVRQRVGIERFTAGAVPVESFDVPPASWRRVPDESWPWNGGKPFHDVLPDRELELVDGSGEAPTEPSPQEAA